MVHKTLSIVSVMIISGMVHSQDVTIDYNSDGSALLNSYSPKGNSFWVLDNNRLTHEEFLFPDGKRRMWSSFVYDDSHIIERQDFIYTQGREKEVFAYDHFGNKIATEEFDFISGNNWKSIYKSASKYDAYNNRVYFSSVGMSGSEYLNSETYYSYDYPNHKRNIRSVKKDKHGRVIDSENYTTAYQQSVIDREAERGKLENQWNRTRRSKITNAKGFRVHEVTTEENRSIQTFNKQGRLATHELFKALGHDGKMPIYKPYFEFKFTYDKTGRVTQQNMIYKVGDREEWKSTYAYSSDGKLIRESIYKLTYSGGWKLIKTRKHASLEPIYTPRIDIKAESHPVSDLTEPFGDSPSTHPSTPSSSWSLVNQLSVEVHERDDTEAQMFDSDRKKLEHLVLVLNNQSDADITEADVLRLALEMLIKEHRDEIKDSNDEFLEEQSGIFDE